MPIRENGDFPRISVAIFLSAHGQSVLAGLFEPNVRRISQLTAWMVRFGDSGFEVDRESKASRERGTG